MGFAEFQSIICDLKQWLEENYAPSDSLYVEPFQKVLVEKEVTDAALPIPEKILKKDSLVDVQEALLQACPYLAKGAVEEEALPFTVEELSLAKICVLRMKSTIEGDELLDNLASAIDTHLAKTLIIEADEITTEKTWKKLLHYMKNVELILVVEAQFYQLSYLQPLYHFAMKPYIGTIPVFFLAEPKAYLQDLELKRHLWHWLQENLKHGR